MKLNKKTLSFALISFIFVSFSKISFAEDINTSKIEIKESLKTAKKGTIIIIGGGTTPKYVRKKIIEASGGKEAKILIVPFADSEPEEIAKESKIEFDKFPLKKVTYLKLNKNKVDFPENLKKAEEATGVFFLGGDQNTLVKILKGTKVLEKIKDVYYKKGGVISGTSAGTAVISKIMITGKEKTDKEDNFKVIKKDNVITSEGFGFMDNVIIDQHFIKRKRHNRLMTLSLEHKNLPCIGIDEETAVIIKDDKLEVSGENSVIIYDSAEAENITKDSKNNLSGQNIKVNLLISGQKFDLTTKKLIP